jgi:hypothetical protein
VIVYKQLHKFISFRVLLLSYDITPRSAPIFAQGGKAQKKA